MKWTITLSVCQCQDVTSTVNPIGTASKAKKQTRSSGTVLCPTNTVEDARLGRFFSVDPLTSEYPHYSPYSFSGNKVIAYRELEGLEESVAYIYNWGKEDAKVQVVDWKDIPGNSNSHGPLGTGKLYVKINLEDGKYRQITQYSPSVGDQIRDIEERWDGNHQESKTRRATDFEKWALKRKAPIKDLIDGFGGARGMDQAEGNGHTLIDEPEGRIPEDPVSTPAERTKKPDSVKVIYKHVDKHGWNRTRDSIKVKEPSDTVGGEIIDDAGKSQRIINVEDRKR